MTQATLAAMAVMLIGGQPLKGVALLFDQGAPTMSKAGPKRGSTPFRRATVVATAVPGTQVLVGHRVNLWGDTHENIEDLGGQLVDAQFTLRDKIATQGGQETYVIENFRPLAQGTEAEIEAATSEILAAQIVNLEKRGARKVTPALAATTPAGQPAPENSLMAAPATGELTPAEAATAEAESFA